MKKSKRLIDLGADFRLKDVNIYQAWYKTEHTAQLLLNNAVYGLPELYREIIKQSVIVANPGCYPTSVILGLAPLLTNEMVDTKTLIMVQNPVCPLRGGFSYINILLRNQH